MENKEIKKDPCEDCGKSSDCVPCKEVKSDITEVITKIEGCSQVKCWEFFSCDYKDKCGVGKDPDFKCWLTAGDLNPDTTHPSCLLFQCFIDSCKNCKYYHLMKRMEITSNLLKKIRDQLSS